MSTKTNQDFEIPAVDPEEVEELLTREIAYDDKVNVRCEGSLCTYTKDGKIVTVLRINDKKEAIIKPGTKAIRKSCFNPNYLLETIILPESVIAIEEGAFMDVNATIKCETPHFKFTNGILYTADMKTMLYAKNAAEIVIPEGVKRIGEGALHGCNEMMSVAIPTCVTSIGRSAFKGCDNLRSIVIPDTITEIADDTFYGCKSLQSITIPSFVARIGNGAFSGCESLQVIVIPDTVTYIGNCAFDSCRSLQDISIPDGVTSIEDYAFYGCYQLQSIRIPDNVTSIEDYAFYGCKRLQNIRIPDSVIYIGNRAFYGCDKLQSIPKSTTL